MGISALFARHALGAAALLVSLTVFGTAQAVPIYTYTFAQTGYLPTGGLSGVGPATVTGSFSGALDASGHITRNTLTAYHFEITGFESTFLGLYDWSHDTLPFLFSYIPGDTGSFGLVDTLAHSPTLLKACIGLPAGISCNGGNARGAMASTDIDFSSTVTAVAFTDAVPVLVGSVADIGDPVYLATTPIPASLLLFGTACGGLSLLAIRRRRQDPVALPA